MKDLDLVILGYALRGRKFMTEIVRAVSPQFFSGNFKDFYVAISSAFTNPEIKEVLSPTALLQYCDTIGLSQSKTKISNIYDAALKVSISSDADFKFHLKQFKDQYNRNAARDLSELIKDSLARGLDTKDINKLLGETNRAIAAINNDHLVDQGSLGDDIVNIYKEYGYISDNPTEFKGVMSGFVSLDERTNGFFGGELIVWAGWEGSGKSLVCGQIAVNAHLGSNTINSDLDNFASDGKNIVYLSLEMPRSNKGKMSSAAYLNKRMVSCMGAVPFRELRMGCLSEEDLGNFKKTCKFIKEYDKHRKLYIADMPRGTGVDEVEAKYLEAKEMFEPDLMVIDYIGIMNGSDPDAPDWHAQGKIAADLHELARVYNIPIMTPCQVNRPSTQGHSLNNQKYNTSRLARASGISQNANIVAVIESRDNEHSYNDMQIQLVKVRDAEKGSIQLIKDFPKMRVYDPMSTNVLMDQVDDLIGVG